MNERIKELAEQQAGSILMDLVMPDAGMPERIKWNVGCTTSHLEKFAELIIRECADAIIKDSRLNDVRSAANGCVRTIKQHFGVEE